MILAGGEGGASFRSRSTARSQPCPSAAATASSTSSCRTSSTRGSRASRCSPSTRARRSRSTSRACGACRRSSISSSRRSPRSSARASRGSADRPTPCTSASTSSTDEKPELVCIFGGDHVYKMDVRQMIAFHQRTARRRDGRRHPGAADTRRATSGVIEVDDNGRIVAFHEKVENPPPMPRNPEHVPRVDGQLHLPDRRCSCASSTRTRASRRAATTSATTSSRAS